MRTALLLSVLMAVLAAVPAEASSKWRGCGTYNTKSMNGYITINRVQARGGASCTTARHIAVHFDHGGYEYHGLVCFFAPMGSGNSYWNFGCRAGDAEHSYGSTLVRGHSRTVKN